MRQWVESGTRRACLFGVILGVLMGCNDGGDEKQADQGSTFDTVLPEPRVDESKVADEPVLGTVTVVPDTELRPTEVTDPPPSEPKGGEEETILIPATRLTGIAPDTDTDRVDGETYTTTATIKYELGDLVAEASGDWSGFSNRKVFITPIKGWIRYPKELANPIKSTTTTPRPVIVFLHGHHGPQFDNYQGYNYLAEELADHGYIVLSIDANAINGETLTASGGDASSHSRAQLVLGTLDRLRQINENGQLEKDGKTPGLLNPLKGKMDFSRIGIMGHSRGGQAVSNTILFNKTRRGVTKKQLKDALKANPDAFRFAYPFAYTLLADAVIPRAGTRPASIDEAKFKIAAETYNLFYAAGSKYANGKDAETYAFKGAFMLAPTDFAGNSGLDQVPLANLLPSCDGDVDNLQGARAYDHNRFGPAGDTAPRYQILVRGANHNYYNTIWTNDDYFGKFDVAEYFVPVSNEYCEPRRKDTVRLNEEDQRRGGKFIINSFMRYHVGGEQNFGYYWNGTEQLPPEACPVGDEVCDERAVLTVQTNGGNAKLIHRFNQTDSLTRNALGNAATFSGFDKNGIASCTMPLGETTIGTCSPQLLAGFAYAGSSNSGGFLSIADHAELSWSKTDPSKQGASIVEDITGLSAAGYDSLTFRIAVVRPMGQEVEVTLSDGKETATVKASDFSDALYNAPRKKKGGDVPKDKDLPLIDDTADKPYADGQVRMLNMVAIPLQAFVKVDMTNLKKLELTFPKESGKVAIADIELQNLGRDNPTVTVASKQ